MFMLVFEERISDVMRLDRNDDTKAEGFGYFRFDHAVIDHGL